jgi:beta-xylosidase
MISLAGSFRELTPPDYVEGPVKVKRKGTYYLMWSEGEWTDHTYSAAYATGPSPLGPFEKRGKLLESDPLVANGPGHHAVINIPGTDEWYVAYHRRPLSEKNGNHRVTCIDKLVFADDGTIAKVRLTNEGVPARPLPPVATPDDLSRRRSPSMP